MPKRMSLQPRLIPSDQRGEYVAETREGAVSDDALHNGAGMVSLAAEKKESQKLNTKSQKETLQFLSFSHAFVD